MPGVREILDRFRPAGAPGGATRAGVPVDRAETLVIELRPVFDELAPVLQECARIGREVAETAQRRESEAARRALAIVARARTASEAERAAAAASARARVARETERTMSVARDDAEAVRLRGEQRRARLLAAVLDLVRADLHGLTDDDHHRRKSIKRSAGP